MSRRCVGFHRRFDGSDAPREHYRKFREAVAQGEPDFVSNDETAASCFGLQPCNVVAEILRAAFGLKSAMNGLALLFGEQFIWHVDDVLFNGVINVETRSNCCICRPSYFGGDNLCHVDRETIE